MSCMFCVALRDALVSIHNGYTQGDLPLEPERFGPIPPYTMTTSYNTGKLAAGSVSVGRCR